MAIKFGKDGTLYCNHIKYNYKQARNIVSDGCYGNLSGTWSFSNAEYTSDPHGYKAYRCFRLKSSSGVRMISQSAPTPTAGHKYYGSCMWMTPNASYTVEDCRFEWWVNDTDSGHLTFGYKNFPTNGQWVKISSIQSISSVSSGSWAIRNFVVNQSSESYVTRMIIVDLTDTFGSGNEPSKEWCDANIREHETIVNWGCVSSNSTTSTWPFTEDSWSSCGKYKWLSLNSNWEPREYMWHQTSNTSKTEAFVRSAKNYTLDPSAYYYGYWEVHADGKWMSNSFDSYFPPQEPLMGQNKQVNPTMINGGGGMQDWHREGFFANRTSFSSGSYQFRLDYNNKNLSVQIRWTAWNLIEASENPLVQYNAYNGSNATVTDLCKEWCNRWIDGRSSPIIHIKDPTKKYIKFNKPNPIQELKRASTSTYSKANLDSYSTLTNDTWSSISNASSLVAGQYGFLTCTNTTDNTTVRFIVKVLSVSGSTVTTDNYGWGTSGTFWWKFCDGYDIECNDVEVRPELNCVKFDSTGTIKCKKLITEIEL